MLRLIRWFVLLALWKNHKYAILSIVSIVISLIVFSNIINDLIEYTDKSSEDLISLKWAVICFFSIIAVYFSYRIIINKPFFSSFAKDSKKSQILSKEGKKLNSINNCSYENDSSFLQTKKKSELLSKTAIKTKSERILDKYSKNKGEGGINE